MRRTRVRYTADAYRRPPFYRTLATVFAYFTGAFCAYAFLMFLAVNWLSRCGDRVWTSATTWHMGECISMATIISEWLW